MKIFPHILARIGGSSYDFFKRPMTFENLNGISDEIADKESKRKGLKNEISQQLYTCIGRISDSILQNQLLNLRRDIYNDRKLNPEKITEVHKMLPEETRNLLEAYFAAVQAVENLKREGASVYHRATEEGRQALQRLASDKTLQEGLVISSKTLLENVDHYIKKNPVTFRKKEWKTELSLLKYLTRTCTKTSPFSTFTQLALGGWKELQKDPIQFYPADTPKPGYTSHIRLNHFLFKYLKELIFTNGDLAGYLPVRLNPTTTLLGEQFHYLTNHSQIESFQCLQSNRALTLILEYLQSTSGQSLTLHKLTSRIHSQINASPEEIYRYLQKLIGLGFLEFYLGISGNDPEWDTKLIRQLEPLAIHQSLFGHIAESLKAVREHAGYYALADAGERKRLLEATCLIMKSMGSLLYQPPLAEVPYAAVEAHKVSANSPKSSGSSNLRKNERQDKEQHTVPFPFQPENMFYEDTLKTVNFDFDRQELTRFVKKLDGLIHHLQLFDFDQEEKQKMQSFFLHRYGENARIGLLRFYEDYYREVKKPEAEYQKNNAHGERNTPLVPPVPASRKRHAFMTHWKQAFGQQLKYKQPDPEVFHLESQLFASVNAAIGFYPEKKAASYGAFVQFFKEEDAEGVLRLKGVLNHHLPGFGKFISRYLHLFEKDILQDTLSWNQNMGEKDELLAENCDNTHFNANIHPTLMPFEISSPGSQNSLSSAQQLPVADLEISFDGKKGQLVLAHRKRGQKVLVFDLGFQASYFRSELFKMLNYFSAMDNIVLAPVKNGINQVIRKSEQPNESGIRVRPRIVLDDQVVLKRKSWHIPPKSIPVKQSHESDWDYFCKLHQWRKHWKIPDEVFIIVNPDSRFKKGQEKQITVSKDDYKPQYIDFNNPLLVRLFQNATNRVEKSLILEEMYPAPHQMLAIGEEKYVTEFLVQWYHFPD